MNSESINQGIFTIPSGASQLFPSSCQSENNNDFQTLFKARMLGNDSTKAKVEARTMTFAIQRVEINPLARSAKSESKPHSFDDQFKRTTKLSKKAETEKTRTTTKPNVKKSDDYKSRIEAENKRTRTEQSNTTSKQVTESDVHRHEDNLMAETATKENLEAQKPETKELETQELETQELETQEPETQELETQESETQELETQESETQELETQELETQDLETQELDTQDLAKVVESFAKLEEKIEELVEAGDLEKEVEAKLSELVAVLHEISESTEVDEIISEKLADLANELVTQLEDLDSSETLSVVIQQSNSMIEVLNAVFTINSCESDANYLEKIPELQKAFASTEKGTANELSQNLDVDEKNVDETVVENIDDNEKKLSAEQHLNAESKEKSDSKSKHQRGNSESKITQQTTQQDKASEIPQANLRQKLEIQNDTSKNSQETSVAEEISASETTDVTVEQTTVSPVKAEAVAQAAITQSIEKHSDVNQIKDSLSAKKAETSITGTTSTESGNQKSNTSSQNGHSQGMNSGTNYNSSGLTSARNATPQTNPAHFAQLLEKAELLKTNNGKQILSLEMTPEELGKLEMELTSKDGILTARISAENTLARAKLELMATQIKENLLEQGINLSEITVDISSKNPDEQERSAMFNRKNKSKHGSICNISDNEEIIRKNILPNLRRSALNIKAVDLTV